MRSTKARRGLSVILAVLMAVSVAYAGFTAASARYWLDPLKVSRDQIAPSPTVEFKVPDRIMVANANGYTFGSQVIAGDDMITFRLLDEGQGLDLVENSVRISYSVVSKPDAPNNHLLDLKIRSQPRVSGSQTYVFGMGEGGTGTAGDVIRLTATYRTKPKNDPNGVQRAWSVSNYCYIDDRRGEAFLGMMVDKKASGTASAHWTNTVLYMPGSLGEAPAGIPATQMMTGDSNAVAAVSKGYLMPLMRQGNSSVVGGLHEYMSLWGMPTDGYLRLITGDSLFPGLVFRVLEEWGANDWTVGGSMDDIAALKGNMEKYIPVAHYYHDQASSDAVNTPIQLVSYSAGDKTAAAQYEGGNCPISVGNISSSSATLTPANPTLNAGNSGLATLVVGGPSQTNGSASTFRVTRKVRYSYTGSFFGWPPMGDKWVNFDEKIDVTVHFYNKQYLRQVVKDIQALKMQEAWMLDLGKGGYDAELGELNVTGTPNANYNPWSEFEYAYANAVAVLNRSDVPASGGSMQRKIDEVTAALLDNIQSPQNTTSENPYRVATPVSFDTQYESTVGIKYVRKAAKLLPKPADYGVINRYLVDPDFPEEYWLDSPLNEKYFEEDDFRRLDQAIQDIYADDYPLDVRYQKVLADQAANLAAALFPPDGSGELIKYRPYKVTFESYGGTLWALEPGGDPNNIWVRVYDPITLPLTKPTYSGYVFEGWERYVGPGANDWVKVTGPGPDYNFIVQEYMGIEDVKYRAIWEPNALIGYFDISPSPYQGGQLDRVVATVGTNLTAPTLDLNSTLYRPYGYTFGGWVHRDTGESAFTGDYVSGYPATARGSMYFRAIWNPVKNDVIFYNMPSGGDPWFTIKDKPYNTEILKPSGIPLRTGYNFVEWSETPMPGGSPVNWNNPSHPIVMDYGMIGTPKPFFPIFSDTGPFWMTFYQDIPNGINFMKDKIFHPDEGLLYLSPGVPARSQKAYNQPFNNLDPMYWPTKEGAQFTGRWLMLNENTGELEVFHGFGETGNETAYMPNHNVFLYPEFTGYYKLLKFFAHEGDATPIRILGKEGGKLFELTEIPIPSESNQRFLGWFYENGDPFDSPTMPYLPDGVEELQLFGHWQDLKAENVSIRMVPVETDGTDVSSGSTLLPGDRIKLDVSIRSTFTVYGNYTVIYYDSTYFEPCSPTDNEPYIEVIQGGSTSSLGISDFLILDPAKGIWTVGGAELDVNVQIPIDYPAEWKDAYNQLLPEYKKYGVIAIKVPYDFELDKPGAYFDTETPWFSFYLRVKDGLSPDCSAPATPEDKTADIFFAQEAIRDFENGSHVNPMYYCAGPQSWTYQNVEVLTTPALRYIIKDIPDPVMVKFDVDPTKGKAVDTHGQEVTNIRFAKEKSIGVLKLEGTWPKVQEEVAWEFVGWVTKADYDFFENQPDREEQLEARILDDSTTFTQGSPTELTAFFKVAKVTVTVERRLQNPSTFAEEWTVTKIWKITIDRGDSFSIATDLNNSDYHDEVPGYTHEHDTSREAVEGVVLKDELLWLNYYLKWVTFTFDMDGTDNGVVWGANGENFIKQPWGTNAPNTFYMQVRDNPVAWDVDKEPHKTGYTFIGSVGKDLDYKIAECKDAPGTRPDKFLVDTVLKPVFLPKQVTIQFVVYNYADPVTGYGNYHSADVDYWVVGATSPLPVGFTLSSFDIPRYNNDYRSPGDIYVPSGYGHEAISYTAGFVVPATDADTILLPVGRVVRTGRTTTYWVELPDAEKTKLQIPTDPPKWYNPTTIPGGEEAEIPLFETIKELFGEALPQEIRDYGVIKEIDLLSGAGPQDPPKKYDPDLGVHQGVLLPIPGNNTTRVTITIRLTIPDSCYVAYNANDSLDVQAVWKDGSPPAPEYFQYEEGGRIYQEDMLKGKAQPVITRTGYKFAGWAERATDRVAPDYVSMVKNTLATPKDVYAIWVPLVTFLPGTGLELPSEFAAPVSFDDYYKAGLDIPWIALPKAGDTGVVQKREKQTFLGWVNADKEPEAAWDAVKPLTVAYGDAPLTLYPVWKKNTYTIVFDVPGNQPIFAPMEDVHCDATVKLPTEEPVSEGHIFLGWKDDPASTKVYAAGENYSNPNLPDGTVLRLYSIWETEQFVLKFKLPDDTTGIYGQMPDEWFDYDWPIDYGPMYQEDLPNPDNYWEWFLSGWTLGKVVGEAEYVFSHWATSQDPNASKVDPIMITGDVTLYPVFVPLTSPHEPVYLASNHEKVIVDDYQHFIYGFPAETRPAAMFGNYGNNVPGTGLITVVGKGTMYFDNPAEYYVGTGMRMHLVNDTLPDDDPSRTTYYTFVLFGDISDGRHQKDDLDYCDLVLNVTPSRDAPSVFMTPIDFAMTFMDDMTYFAPVSSTTREMVKNFTRGSWTTYDYGQAASDRYKQVEKYAKAQGIPEPTH